MTELPSRADVGRTCLGGDQRCSWRPRLRAVGCDIRIVDSDGTPLPVGEIGEIAVRSDIMRGYWNRPDLTAETVKNGWMITGDAAHMDAHGFIYIVDRVKDMIISGGENVYSARSSRRSIATRRFWNAR